MTDAQLVSQALTHLRRMTVTWKTWEANVKAGKYANPGATEGGKAEALLKQIGKPAVPPPPKPADNYLDPVRNLLVFATVTDDAIQHACKLPSSWKAIYSADPAYRVTDQQIAAVKASGHEDGAWCDCDQTPFSAAKKMVADRGGLDRVYGQCESPAQFAFAYVATARLFIGKADALLSGQLAKVASAEVLLANEAYYNVQPDLHPDWRNANKGIGGNVLAVYGSTTEGATYTPLEAQHKNGWFNPATDSLYTEGMLEADWLYLRRVA